MSDSPTGRSRLGTVAGLLGAATAFTFVLGAGPVPSVFQLAGVTEDVSGNCDEAEHANDPECGGSPSTGGNGGSTSSTVDDPATSTTVGGSNPTTPSGPATAVRSIDAAGAGTVVVAVDGGTLRLVAATPTAGWRVEVEQGSGREVEVDFRSGTQRVQVNVELEDGQVRERVRVRDDADGTDVRSQNGGVVRDDSDGRIDDDGGHGSDDDSDDDRSGSNHGSDDDSDDDDDHSGSGHGGDDDSGDDNSGHRSDDD